MNSKKSVFASKTNWLIFSLMILILIQSLHGNIIPIMEQARMNGDRILDLLFGFLAMYSRIKATKKLAFP